MGKGICTLVAAKAKTLGVGLLLACLSTAWLAHAQKSPETAKPVAWAKVPAPERKVLSVLEKDWDQITGGQQRKLLSAAKGFDKLMPIQQQRFQERIADWAKLTPEARKAAREKYKDLAALPYEKQDAIRERWNDTKPGSTPASPATSPAK